MATNALVRARIDERIKEEANIVLEAMGLLCPMRFEAKAELREKGIEV